MEHVSVILDLILWTESVSQPQVVQHVVQTAKITVLDSVFVMQDFTSLAIIVFKVQPVLPQVQEMPKENAFVIQVWINMKIIVQNVLSEPFTTTLQKNVFSFVDKIQITMLQKKDANVKMDLEFLKIHAWNALLISSFKTIIVLTVLLVRTTIQQIKDAIVLIASESEMTEFALENVQITKFTILNLEHVFV